MKKNLNHVEGEDRGQILLFALSTCIWCRKTKHLLDSLGVAYDYIDVDLLEESERVEVEKALERWNPLGSFPTIVINEQTVIQGFDEDRIREAIGS